MPRSKSPFLRGSTPGQRVPLVGEDGSAADLSVLETPAGLRSLIHDLIKGQTVLGPIILEVADGFRESSLRGGFIALLREAEPCTKLSRPSFLILLDLLRVCLKESASNSNYSHMRSILNLSFQYGATVCGQVEYVGSALQGNEHWNCVPFWLYCLEEWVRFDVLRFTSPAAATEGILDISDTSFIAALTIIRMQVIAMESMRSVHTTSQVIEEFINTASALHGLSGANIDMLRRPSLQFIAFIQDTILEIFRPSLKLILSREKARSERRLREASSPTSTAAAEPEEAEGVSAIASPRTRKKERSSSRLAAEEPSRATYAQDIGFSPLIELMYVLVNINYWRDGPGVYLKEYNKICVCNSPCGYWETVGNYETEEPGSELHPRWVVNRLLCEACFRRMTDASPMPCLVSNLNLTGVCVVERSWEPLVAPVSFARMFFVDDSKREELPDEDVLRLSFDPMIRKIVKLSIGHLARPSNLRARESLLEYEGLKLCSGAFAPGQFVRYLNLKSPVASASSPGSPASRQMQGASGGLVDKPVRVREPPSPSRSRSKSPTSSTARSNLRDAVAKRAPDAARDTLALKRDQKKKIDNYHMQTFISIMHGGIDVEKQSSNDLLHRMQPRTVFLDSATTRLCWLPPGRSNLIPSEKSFINLSDIQSVKTGTDKHFDYINIISADRELVLRIEEEDTRKTFVAGLIALLERNRSPRG